MFRLLSRYTETIAFYVHTKNTPIVNLLPGIIKCIITSLRVLVSLSIRLAFCLSVSVCLSACLSFNIYNILIKRRCTYGEDWREKTFYLGYSYDIFSRVHATFQPAVSVGRSVTLCFFSAFIAFFALPLLPKCFVSLFYHCPSPPARDFGSRVSRFDSIQIW